MRKTFALLKERVSILSDSVSRLEGERDAAVKEAQRLTKRRDDLKEEDIVLSKTTEVLGVLQRKADARGHRSIEKVVNRVLDAVFGGENEFVFVQEQKREVTNTIPCIKMGDSLMPIHDARGGGLEDVVSFVLQMLAVFRTKPSLRRILIFDEPMAHLAVSQTPIMAELVKELVDEFGVTMLMTTHNPEFARLADKHYEAYQEEPGKTVFREVTGE